MKATVLALLATVMISFTNVNAQNNVIYSNISINDNGMIKEYIAKDIKTKAPLRKYTFVIGNEGLPTQRIVYRWIDKEGWLESQRYEYQYIGSNLMAINYREWIKGKQTWNYIQQTVYPDSIIYLAEEK